MFITGDFFASVDFGGGKLTSNGSYDIFVASFSSSGSHRWSKAFGSNGNDGPGDITTDDTGNVYVTGSFRKSIDIGGGSLSSNGGDDMFIASLDSVGNHRWSRSHGSTSIDTGVGIVTDSSNSIYVAGYFKNVVDFGGGPFICAGDADIVLVKLSQ